jgi:CRP-like cAMP-binding protein
MPTIRASRRSSKLDELRRIRLFDNLPRRDLELIAANLDEVTVPAGETLVRQGHHNDAFWIILEGEAAYKVRAGGSRTLGPGDFFGVTSMLDGKPAVGTIKTTTRMRALVASAAQFRALEGNDTIALRLMAAALERMREDLESHHRAHKA